MKNRRGFQRIIKLLQLQILMIVCYYSSQGHLCLTTKDPLVQAIYYSKIVADPIPFHS